MGLKCCVEARPTSQLATFQSTVAFNRPSVPGQLGPDHALAISGKVRSIVLLSLRNGIVHCVQQDGDSAEYPVLGGSVSMQKGSCEFVLIVRGGQTVKFLVDSHEVVCVLTLSSPL